MVLAFARGAGPLIGVGVGAVMSGASLLWPSATGPIFFYGGVGLIALGTALWTLGRWLGRNPKPAPTGALVERGSVILSHNQTGGQVAHEIHNYGPPRRVISVDVRSRMADVLHAVAPARIGVASTQGDVEAHEFKRQLMEVFGEAGWQVDDMQTFMFFGTKKGLVLTIPSAASVDGLTQVVAKALAQTGSPVAVNRGDMANECGLYVQVWHSP